MILFANYLLYGNKDLKSGQLTPEENRKRRSATCDHKLLLRTTVQNKYITLLVWIETE